MRAPDHHRRSPAPANAASTATADRRQRRKLNEPYGVVVDRNGTIFFADRLNRRVRKIDRRRHDHHTGRRRLGAIQRRRRDAADAGLAEPNGLALNADQPLFIADVADHRVRVVDLRTGMIALRRHRRGQHDGDGGPATEAGMFGARAVAFAPDGSLYVMERQGSCIRHIATASSTPSPAPASVAMPATVATRATRCSTRRRRWRSHRTATSSSSIPKITRFA